jgi:hypothetical protein
MSDPRPTRRAVVKTGARLAYAVPLVAATTKLSASDALAAISGPATPTRTPTPSPTCFAAGQPCTNTDDCCDPFVCNDGTCGPQIG